LNKRTKGEQYEDRAVSLLVKKGHEILARNFRNRYGEIDIISHDKVSDELVFTEVKYRSGNGFGYAAEAVTLNKQKNISLVARYFIMKCPAYSGKNIRFDVFAFEGDLPNHIEGAFLYNGF